MNEFYRSRISHVIFGSLVLVLNGFSIIVYTLVLLMNVIENTWCMVDVFSALVYTQVLLMTAVEST